MFIIIFFLLAFKSILCSIKIIPVTDLIKGSIISEYYLYCTESSNGDLNLFYKVDDFSEHLIYDKNEEFISKTPNNEYYIKKLEYISDKEYIIVSKNSVYFENKYNGSHYSFSSSSDDFFILKNNDLIIIKYVPSLRKLGYYFKLDYYYYPYHDTTSISISVEQIFFKHYEIVETTEAVLFFILLDEKALTNNLDVYALDKTLLKFERIDTIYEEAGGFSLIRFNKISDEFIYCVTELTQFTLCNLARYRNKKITLVKSIEVFSWECVLTKEFRKFKKNYAVLNDEKIAIICDSTYNMFLTLFEYKNNNLILGNIVDKEIIDFPSLYTHISNVFLFYNLNKGLILYNLLEYSNNYTYQVVKSYIEESCSSFDILTQELERTNISFYDHISGGLKENKPNFIITEIGPKIILYKNDKNIRAGETEYNKDDSFSFMAAFSETPLFIKFKTSNSDFSCSAIINIFYYKIGIKDNYYRCNRDPNIEIVNNITDHDLNKSFDINVEDTFFFTLQFVNDAQEPDLKYKYSNIEFLCEKRGIFKQNSVYCNFPANFALYPPDSVKYEYDIYSRLSCLNSLYIGSVTIEDPYLIEIIEAENLTKISENIDKTYDASEKIKKFSIDMMNYYIWFASFPYCDDDIIKSGKCCKDEILTDWDIVSYKQYITSFEFFTDEAEMHFIFRKIKKRIAEINQVDEETIDFDISYGESIFKYVIFKNTKFKKYIISFASHHYLSHYLKHIMFSDMIEFDKDSNIKVNNFFYLIFNLMKNDLFSKSILNNLEKNKDYQLIFTGHGLGGALATLASYYYTKNNIAELEPVLITYGQPRVGNENFARDYMNIISNVYRIVTYGDYGANLPPINKQDNIFHINSLKKTKDFIYKLLSIKPLGNLIKKSIKFDLSWNIDFKPVINDKISLALDACLIIGERIANEISDFIPYGYCHIGGLYVINEKVNKIYHCKDIYNQEITSPICKNKDTSYLTLDTTLNPVYFTGTQDPFERCQNKFEKVLFYDGDF